MRAENKIDNGLSEFDWNFDSVPANELIACCYWEYARESAFIRNTLRQYREWFLADGKRDEETGRLMANLEKIQFSGQSANVYLRGCAFETERVWQSENPEKSNYRHPCAPPITGSFPSSWQSLSKVERDYRARIPTDVEELRIVPVEMSHWSLAKEIARVCGSVAEEQHQQRKTWEKKYLCRDEMGNSCTAANAPPVLEFGPIHPRIRWGAAETLMVDIAWEYFTNDEIVTYFRKWVKTARPKKTPSPSRRGHKLKDWRAHLMRLAAMRLLSHFTASDIVDTRRERCPAVWKTKTFSGNQWADTTKWYDARREARKLFCKLFPFLPKNEKPISWERQAPHK
jgi:hypothetical protein